MDVSIAELLASGLKLMSIGMGIVFFFLMLLVAVIHQIHGILRRIEAGAGNAAHSTVDAPGGDVAVAPELVAAVAAAIHHYEQRARRQGVANG